MDTDDLVTAIAPVVATFHRLGVRYFVGGSVASSFHGAIRSTMDVDVVSELPFRLAEAFATSFSTDYYLSEEAIRYAIQRKSCFNLIHLPTASKVDGFVSRGRPFDERSMERAVVHAIGSGQGVAVPIATAEDSIVSKLEWFRLTDETSERQWDDVRRLVELLGDSLDADYMREMADSIGVRDLVDTLLSGPGKI